MRTLKKSLSLVLVLVLCFGLVGSAFAANLDMFDDADKIDENYVEAVDVFTGLKIVEGDAGKFDPEGNFTRAALTKIAAYMTLGPSAKNLSGTTAKFMDVPMGHWAQPFVAYCASMGLVEGDGDGNFRPDAPINGFEMSVLMLRSVGYGAKNEFSGAEWSLNASKGALQTGVLNSALIADGANSNAALQRDQAIQMAFNTLTKVNTVKFSALISDYVENDKSAGGLGTAIDPVLLSGNFNLMKDTFIDDYGFGAHRWFTGSYIKADGSNIVSEEYRDGEVFATIEGPVTVGKLLTQYKAKQFASSVAYYYNGARNVDVNYSMLAAMTSTDVLIPAGSTAYLVDEVGDGYITDIIIVEEYAGVVSSINSTAGTAVVKTKLGNTNIENTKGYVKGDVLLTVPAFNSVGAGTVSNPITGVTKGTSFIADKKVAADVNGKVSATGVGYIKIDGVQYYLSKNIILASDVASITLGTTYDIYLDSTGAVCYVANPTAVATVLDYCYLTASKYIAPDPLDGVAMSARASIVKTDGTEAVVNIYTILSGSTVKYINGAGATVDADPSNAPYAEGYYSYTVKDDGSYVFKAATGLTNGQTINIEKGSPTVEVNSVNKLATSATVLSVANKGTVTTKTGYAGYTASDDDVTVVTGAVSPNVNKYALVEYAASGVISRIFVFSPAPKEAAPIVAYYFGVTGDTTADGTYYYFYIDGEVKAYIINGTAPVANNLYALTLDADGEGTVGTANTFTGYSVVTGEVVAVDAGYFTVDTGNNHSDADVTVLYAATYKVYDITTAGTIVEDTLTGRSTSVYGDNVVVLQKTSDTSTALVFITADGADY